MRVKQIWTVLPLPSYAKTFWDRITLSRLTTAYFVFSICHCLVQVGLQIRTFTINADAVTVLSRLALDTGITDQSLPVPDLGPGYLRLCPDVPGDIENPDESCKTVWNSTASANQATSSDTTAISIPTIPISSSASVALVDTTTAAPLPTGTGLVVVPTSATTDEDAATNALLEALAEAEIEEDSGTLSKRDHGLQFIEVISLDDESAHVSFNGEDETLSATCLWSLHWPMHSLELTKREDIVFIAFQVWVLGMSVVALLNESIPHMFASLATHVLATGWAGYQIYSTAKFQSRFAQIVTKGACDGVNLLPRYWDERKNMEIPLLALNGVALIVSGVLSWKLMKILGWQTYKRVGASRTIKKIYHLVLALHIIQQLALFFIAASLGLWLDSLFNGVAAQVAWYVPLYKASAMTTAVLVAPWVISGWVGVRKERRILMLIFLVLSVVYIGGWSVMFLSTTFRYLFGTWKFFCVMFTASIAFSTISFALGVACRINFGKGLPRYLDAHEQLSEGPDFAPVNIGKDVEKVNFPSTDKPMPTFADSFDSLEDEAPPMFQRPGPPKLGPRFYNQSAIPFETAADMRAPEPAYTVSRNTSSSGSHTLVHGYEVSRQVTKESVGSMESYYNYSSDGGHRRSPSEDSHSRERW